MTNSELNRDIKRLYSSFKNRISENTEKWTNQDWAKYEAEESKLKLEFHRLYHADRNFDVLNIKTMKMMLHLNNSLRVIPFHVFGQITIK